MRGFYIKYSDEKPHPNVLKWDVCILDISRNRRHLDSTTHHRFWEELDKWTALHRDDLRV